MDACIEHVANFDSIEDEAGANQAIQMLRALRHKNVSAAVNSSPSPQHRLGISSIDICCSHSHQTQQSPFQEEPFVEREEVLNRLCPIIVSHILSYPKNSFHY
jgi:cell envelope opacity-associated protein A